MSSKSRLGQFDDVRLILDAALASNGGEVELPTHGEAVHWRQRAYRFRKMFAETISAISPYDKLSFPRIEEGSRKVIIKVGVTNAIFTPANTTFTPVPEDDPVLQAALEVAKKNGVLDDEDISKLDLGKDLL